MKLLITLFLCMSILVALLIGNLKECRYEDMGIVESVTYMSGYDYYVVNAQRDKAIFKRHFPPKEGEMLTNKVCKFPYSKDRDEN